VSKIKIRVRFDYSARTKSGKKLFGNKPSDQQAEELRQHKVSQIRNIPVQGISIEDIDMSQEIYSVIDELTGKETYYAPVIIIFDADSLEDVLRFIMKEEFRTVEILEPDELSLSRLELERLLLRINEQMASYRHYLERIVDNWK